jgi:hypothetical protein
MTMTSLVERRMPRRWVLVLLPVLVFAIAVAAAYTYAAANPLSWNGYGRDAYRNDSMFTLPASSSVTVHIAGDEPIPAHSYVRVQVYVVTKGADENPVTTDFQFSYNGEMGPVVPGWGLGEALETKVSTQGGTNPIFIVHNLQPYDLVVEQYGHVIVPPTTWDHFVILLPLVAVVGTFLSIALDGTITYLGRRGARGSV